MSQDDLARALRHAGADGANKRLVQRWEAGSSRNPRPAYARALERVTGMPLASLGFDLTLPTGAVAEDGAGGHDIGSPAGPTVSAPAAAPRGSFSGIWLSRYEYFSSGRAAAFVGAHYVVLLQHGDRLTVRSLPDGSLNPKSPLSMDLSADGNVITGTWVEETDPEGYYRGARYHGAIQMLAEPTGRRMSGKWVGFGADMDVNTGPWVLVFQEASTGKAAMGRYNHPPSAEVQPVG